MDEDDEQSIHSIFPLPPPFYRHFTTTNLAALEAAKKENFTSQPKPGAANASTDTSASPSLTAASLLGLPAEVRESLTYLIPPEPPTEDAEYRVFGKPTKISGDDEFEQIMRYVSGRFWDRETNWGTLPLWQYERLYPELAPGEKWSSLDRQTYLFRFLRSMLLKHVELLGSLAANPAAVSKDKEGNTTLLRDEPQDAMQPWGPKKDILDKAKDRILRDILTLVMNMHALINEYRPHQARETLIRVLESQVERKKAEIEGVRRMGGRVRETLEGFGDALGEGMDGEGDERAYVAEEGIRREAEAKEWQREMWKAMDEIAGH